MRNEITSSLQHILVIRSVTEVKRDVCSSCDQNENLKEIIQNKNENFTVPLRQKWKIQITGEFGKKWGGGGEENFMILIRSGLGAFCPLLYVPLLGLLSIFQYVGEIKELLLFLHTWILPTTTTLRNGGESEGGGDRHLYLKFRVSLHM